MVMPRVSKPLPENPIKAAEGWLKSKKSVKEMLREVRQKKRGLKRKNLAPILWIKEI